MVFTYTDKQLNELNQGKNVYSVNDEYAERSGDNRVKLEDEREKYDNEFRKKRNDLDEEFHRLRRDYASTNE